MPNVLLTVQDIADQAALRLRENEVMSRLVSRDFDDKIADALSAEPKDLI